LEKYIFIILTTVKMNLLFIHEYQGNLKNCAIKNVTWLNLICNDMTSILRLSILVWPTSIQEEKVIFVSTKTNLAFSFRSQVLQFKISPRGEALLRRRRFYRSYNYGSIKWSFWFYPRWKQISRKLKNVEIYHKFKLQMRKEHFTTKKALSRKN
jgi:hypothetical protein